MNLQEFVKTTLVQISNGIEEAQEELQERAVVNPQGRDVIGSTQNQETGVQSPVFGWKDIIHSISFDVAVTAEEVKSGGGEAGIKVASLIQVGGKGGKEVTQGSVSRVQFSVPIVLPHPKG